MVTVVVIRTMDNVHKFDYFGGTKERTIADFGDSATAAAFFFSLKGKFN